MCSAEEPFHRLSGCGDPRQGLCLLCTLCVREVPMQLQMPDCERAGRLCCRFAGGLPRMIECLIGMARPKQARATASALGQAAFAVASIPVQGTGSLLLFGMVKPEFVLRRCPSVS